MEYEYDEAMYGDWLRAIDNRHIILDHVPTIYKKYELCLVSVNINGCSLDHVPEILKDYNMCLAAVTNNPWAIAYIPEEFKTYELCFDAICRLHQSSIKYAPTGLSILNHIPKQYMSFELLLNTNIDALRTQSKYINWDILDQHQTEFIKLKYNI